MANAIMNKVWNLLGMEQQEEEDYEEDNNLYDYDYEEEEEPVVEEKKGFMGKNKNKIISMPQQQPVRMVISQPTTFEQSEEICGFLKEKKSIILNLEYVNKDVARRIVDFVSGGVCCLDAHMEKVSNAIFLIAPTYYEITNEMAREEIKNKLSVSWLNKNSID